MGKGHSTQRRRTGPQVNYFKVITLNPEISEKNSHCSFQLSIEDVTGKRILFQPIVIHASLCYRCMKIHISDEHSNCPFANCKPEDYDPYITQHSRDSNQLEDPIDSNPSVMDSSIDESHHSVQLN